MKPIETAGWRPVAAQPLQTTIQRLDRAVFHINSEVTKGSAKG